MSIENGKAFALLISYQFNLSEAKIDHVPHIILSVFNLKRWNVDWFLILDVRVYSLVDNQVCRFISTSFLLAVTEREDAKAKLY